MTSTFDILRNSIINSGLSEQNKETYLKQLNTTSETTTTTPSSTISPIVRNIVSNPVVNTTIANLGFNPSAIMRDTYKPGFSFKSTTEETTAQQPTTQMAKQVNKQNLKNAVIITKEQETGINEFGKPEIIKSSIQIVQKGKKFNKVNDQRIPLNQQQPFKYSDETPLLDEKLVNQRFPFSKKIKP
jgi:hypothetical protein